MIKVTDPKIRKMMEDFGYKFQADGWLTDVFATRPKRVTFYRVVDGEVRVLPNLSTSPGGMLSYFQKGFTLTPPKLGEEATHNPLLCPVSGCGFRAKRACALASHFRWKHKGS